MSETKIVLRITRGQQMAILDLIMEHLRCEGHTEVFVNCSESPAVETTIADLLNLFSDTSEIELAKAAK